MCAIDSGTREVQSVIESVSQCIDSLTAATDTSASVIACIGLGIPGNVDPEAECTRYLPNFGWTEPVPIGRILRQRFNIPVGLRNDGRCAALAECMYGAGRQSSVFAMLTLGTGIGGALVLNGHLLDGCSFDAGDFGHHVICSGVDAFQCVCGKSGCFEYHASADGLVRHYQRMLAKYGRKDDVGVCNARDFMILYRNRLDDMVVQEAFINYRNDLATGLANLVTFYNPDTICLGGGLSQANELFVGLERLVDDKTLPSTRGKVKIVPASLGMDSGAIGAAIVGFMRLGENIR